MYVNNDNKLIIDYKREEILGATYRQLSKSKKKKKQTPTPAEYEQERNVAQKKEKMIILERVRIVGPCRYVCKAVRLEIFSILVALRISFAHPSSGYQATLLLNSASCALFQLILTSSSSVLDILLLLLSPFLVSSLLCHGIPYCLSFPCVFVPPFRAWFELKLGSSSLSIIPTSLCGVVGSDPESVGAATTITSSLSQSLIGSGGGGTRLFEEDVVVWFCSIFLFRLGSIGGGNGFRLGTLIGAVFFAIGGGISAGGREGVALALGLSLLVALRRRWLCIASWAMEGCGRLL